MEDITPEDSAAPVYLVPPTQEELDELAIFAEEQRLLEAELLAQENMRQEARNAALAKLTKLGLTEEEARAVLGV